jgi:phosphatidylethanolamine-binding protein (PEBP) family uncharacterized protein
MKIFMQGGSPMSQKPVFMFLVAILWAATAAAGDFQMTFEWGDIPLCTSGRPNRVPNPKFVLSNVPEGTKFIEFKMKDLDAPSYNHGGGTVTYSGDDVIEPGAFTYLSPCPPGGTHRYRWTARAKEKTGLFSGSIGTAEAMKTYPK